MGIGAFGIDLGSSNIKIYNGFEDTYFMEKNMIAIEGQDTLYAYGDSAFDMYEKAPDNIQVSFPVNMGVILDPRNMNTLIHYFISDQCKGNLHAADYYIAVPTDVTPVDRRAFRNLIRDSNVKARRVYTVEKAIADGLGMDIDVKTSQGVLVVDVGYDTTEISLLSLGGIVYSRLIKTGGQKFDEAIKAAVRKEYGLLIGSKTSEKLKIAVREVESQKRNAVVYGRHIVSGLPVEKEIATELINDSLEEDFAVIMANIRQVLEHTPPELGADIYRHGIYLSGGACQTGKLAAKISKDTGLKVNINTEPIASVIKGLSTIIREERFSSLASYVELNKK
ncbi:MAG: rod shape-determining protein [Lachnospiraceae bacterium]|nr:rod shape-determining protein [Lachnospiraceae bacterium]